MAIVGSSETFVKFRQTRRHHIPEDSALYNQRSENTKSHALYSSVNVRDQVPYPYKTSARMNITSRSCGLIAGVLSVQKLKATATHRTV
jgi:hypothetical protein